MITEFISKIFVINLESERGRREHIISEFSKVGITDYEFFKAINHDSKKVKDLIINSYHEGVKKLIIVTGKGLHSENEKDPYVSKDFGILKHSVPEFIHKNKELMKLIYEIKDANLEDGGAGAFYIYLKKKPIK